ncbi:Hypothetical protein FKW44_014873 [Caligus rogercresseyi]|uniref:Uncharacterized protein n=1 Tax=Caligus rogercresseyi TaxID=217165 RepID=A0A7T8H052_CALRO|nr:Hypothetical protein FKW44_014873 [Caligus rogercresseyi]
MGDTVRKPDLLCFRGDRIYVVDPTIISDKRPFEEAYNDKINKYDSVEFKEALLNQASYEQYGQD